MANDVAPIQQAPATPPLPPVAPYAGATHTRLAPPQERPSTPAGSSEATRGGNHAASPEQARIEAAIRQHRALRGIPHPDNLAAQVWGRAMAKTPVEWLVASIAAAARDLEAEAAGGTHHLPAEAARRVARYCANARRPRGAQDEPPRCQSRINEGAVGSRRPAPPVKAEPRPENQHRIAELFAAAGGEKP